MAQRVTHGAGAALGGHRGARRLRRRRARLHDRPSGHLSAHAAEPGSERLSAGQRGVLLAASAAYALAFLDQTATTTALHDVGRDLGASASELQWVVGAYLLVLAALVPAAGRLADLHGRRRLFLLGVAIFAVGALACALAPTIEALIALRCVQGVGAALIVPLALANVTVALPERRRGWAIGVLATGGTTFLTLGPLIGGALVDLAGWRSVFATAIPIALLSLLVGRRWIPESRAPEPPPPDVLGLGLLALGLGLLVTGLMQAGSWGLGPTVAALAAGVVALACFVVVEQRARDPLVHLRLLRVPRVAGFLLALLAGQFAVMAVTVELLLYLQRSLGYGALAAGLLFLPAVVATPLLSPLAGRIADRPGGGRLLVPAALAVAGGALVWIAALAGREDVWVLLPALALFGLARPFLFTPSTTGPVSALAPPERGVASALVTEGYQLGAALGAAVAGVIVATAAGQGDLVSGFQTAMAVAAAVCLGAAAGVHAILRRA